jgi:hypothetical protein
MWRAARGLGRAIDAGESAPTGRVGVRDLGGGVMEVEVGRAAPSVVTVSSEALVRRGAPRWMPWRRVIPTGVIGELRVAAEQDSEEGRCVVEVLDGARWRRLFAQLSAAEATAAASAIAARLGFQR